MPSRINPKSTRPRVADRTMVDTVHHECLPVSKPIGVVATNEHAAAEMEQSKTQTTSKTQDRASPYLTRDWSRNPYPRFRRREKNVLDIPSYRTAITLPSAASGLPALGSMHYEKAPRFRKVESRMRRRLPLRCAVQGLAPLRRARE